MTWIQDEPARPPGPIDASTYAVIAAMRGLPSQAARLQEGLAAVADAAIESGRGELLAGMPSFSAAREARSEMTSVRLRWVRLPASNAWLAASEVAAFMAAAYGSFGLDSPSDVRLAARSDFGMPGPDNS